ncbi:hypothetical protein ACFSJS_18860 [Streptomyces desertarenae]|uniref:Uncharacterized protein n=1 Tax=Streptomyces desertarenae TaxID=2666184 RepID=A0ABW4PNR3_9ACTN
MATRNATAVADLVRYGTDHRVDVHAVELDVTSQDSADGAVDRIVTEHSRLDVVVHNAEHMVLGAAEALPFGIDTAIVVPGAFTTGTNHFANAGTPAGIDRAEAHGQRHQPLMDDLGKRLAALIPSDADVTEVAEAVARLVTMEHGTRPLRTRMDPSRDGSEVVSAVADRLRADFFRRIGLDSLLTAGSSL